MLAPSVWNILLTFEFCNANPFEFPETRNSCSKFARNLIYAFHYRNLYINDKRYAYQN
jgi:hypothetical protein